jgi:mono/diheme cytochrome c family protein
MSTRTVLARFVAASLAVMAAAAATVPITALPAAKTDRMPISSSHQVADQALIERGRYLARIAGCNDCHTPHYPESGGNVPESEWLTGSTVGWQGPWGTTYPANLRNALQNLSEDQWVALARNARFRPPMPWFILRDMSEQDLRAIHALIRHLGPAGAAAPAYVPPGGAVNGPVIRFPEPAPASAAAGATASPRK